MGQPPCYTASTTITLPTPCVPLIRFSHLRCGSRTGSCTCGCCSPSPRYNLQKSIGRKSAARTMGLRSAPVNACTGRIGRMTSRGQKVTSSAYCAFVDCAQSASGTECARQRKCVSIVTSVRLTRTLWLGLRPGRKGEK